MQYTVQDPQGNSRIIEGPDGATDDEILSHAKDLFGESGGMPSDTGTIDTFRKFYKAGILGTVMHPIISKTPLGMVANAAFPPSPSGSQTPQQSFQADQLGNPDTSVNDFLMAKGVSEAPAAIEATGGAIDSLAGAAKNKFQSIMDILKAPGEAEKLAPATTELQDGLAAKASQASELKAAKDTKDALYGAIPKDVKAPLPTLNSTAEDILNEIKGLSPKTQAQVKALVSNYQDFGRNGAALGDIGVERSVLGDLATNGDGIEKMYAARLGNAIKEDVENFAKTTLVQGVPAAPSSMEGPQAQDLRRMWVDLADNHQNTLTNDLANKAAGYVRPDRMQPQGLSVPTPITNNDIGASINTANSYYKDFANLQQHPVTQALIKARPEEMAAQIFKRGNVDDVNVAKSVLGDGFKPLQGQYYAQIKDAKNLPSIMSKLSPDFLQAAFTPAQATNLQRLAQFKALITKAKFAVTAAGAGAAIKAGEKLF